LSVPINDKYINNQNQIDKSAVGEADKQVMAIQQEEFFSGPLPPPSLLSGYEQICPGVAERIINGGLAEGEHRRSIDHKLIDKEFALSMTGMILGFILAYSNFGYWCIINF